jgi:hypothetical protein
MMPKPKANRRVMSFSLIPVLRTPDDNSSQDKGYRFNQP